MPMSPRRYQHRRLHDRHDRRKIGGARRRADKRDRQSAEQYFHATHGFVLSSGRANGQRPCCAENSKPKIAAIS
jgi:hypothetical protein